MATVSLKVDSSKRENDSLCPRGFSSRFSGFLLPQQHAGRWISCSKLTVVVNELAKVYMMPYDGLMPRLQCVPTSDPCGTDFWATMAQTRIKQLSEALLNGPKLTEAPRCKGKKKKKIRQDA